jgi:CRP-like cAMP-binding protein
MSNTAKVLFEHPFLARLVPEHRDIMVQGAEEKAWTTGEVLFREGQPANRLFLIHEGKVALETHVPGHGDVLIATFGKDQVLGWSWLLPPYVWHFQARALEPTTMTVLDGGHLLVASEKNHYLGFELMKAIAKVILESLQACHQRWLGTGHRPILDTVDKTAQPSSEPPAELTQARLAQQSFFHGLPVAHLNTLVLVARATQFAAGQKLFATGDTATGLFVVERGRVIIEAPCPDGSLPLQTILPGEAVGWSAFCEPYQWHFDGRALDPTSTLFFPAADVRESCARDYHLGYEITKRITRLMLQRLQATRNRMWEACR